MDFEQWWKANKYDPKIPRTFYEFTKAAWVAAESEQKTMSERMEKALRELIRIYYVPDEYEMDQKLEAVERYFKQFVQ